jgi:hypothetical protein
MNDILFLVVTLTIILQAHLIKSICWWQSVEEKETSIDLWSIYEKSNSEKPNKMKNKNGEKAKYIYAK